VVPTDTQDARPSGNNGNGPYAHRVT
jgi:hypothetical protein